MSQSRNHKPNKAALQPMPTPAFSPEEQAEAFRMSNAANCAALIASPGSSRWTGEYHRILAGGTPVLSYQPFAGLAAALASVS